MLLVPAALFIGLFARPIVDVLLNHGALGTADARITAEVLAAFALGLPGFSAFLLCTRAFQARRDTRTVFVLYVLENGINVVAALALYPGYGARGLALAHCSRTAPAPSSRTSCSSARSARRRRVTVAAVRGSDESTATSGRKLMSGIRIVTDSACDLPTATAVEHNIEIVPLTIRFGDEEFVDGRDLSPKEFWARCANSPVLPETAAPSPGEFEAAFRRAGDAGRDGVVCINLSSELSATHQAAQLGAEAIKADLPVARDRRTNAHDGAGSALHRCGAGRG